MRQMTAATSFIQDISYLVDKGESFSIEVVNRHIENHDVLDWLEREFPFQNPNGSSLDLSMYEPSDRKFLHERLDNIRGGYEGNERRKWGISNNGLCLLISWTTEIIRDINHQDRT